MFGSFEPFAFSNNAKQFYELLGSCGLQGPQKTPMAICASQAMAEVTAVGFEPTPLRTGALSQRLRPLGQTVSINTAKRHSHYTTRIPTRVAMDTLGIEPRAFRMQSGCDTTTPCARLLI